MAADVTWEYVLYSIDNMLAETENQDDNPCNLGYHEAALLLTRLEMALSVLCSLLDTDARDYKHVTLMRHEFEHVN